MQLRVTRTKRLGLIVLKIVTIEIAIVVTVAAAATTTLATIEKAFFEHSRKMFGDDSIVELV